MEPCLLGGHGSKQNKSGAVSRQKIPGQGIKIINGERGIGEGEKQEKGSKKQGQYTQRNVVFQSAELAKLKCLSL